MPADELLAQILAQVTEGRADQVATRADIAALRVELATHGQITRGLVDSNADHEDRLRALEAKDVVTPSELEARDERATSQRRWLIGLLGTLTTFVVGEAILLALWLLDRS